MKTSLAGLLLWPAGVSLPLLLNPWDLAITTYSISVFLLLLLVTPLLRKLGCSGKSALVGGALCAVAIGVAGLYHGGLDYLYNWTTDLNLQIDNATHSVESGATNGPVLVVTLAASLTIFFLLAFLLLRAVFRSPLAGFSSSLLLTLVVIVVGVGNGLFDQALRLCSSLRAGAAGTSTSDGSIEPGRKPEENPRMDIVHVGHRASAETSLSLARNRQSEVEALRNQGLFEETARMIRNAVRDLNAAEKHFNSEDYLQASSFAKKSESQFRRAYFIAEDLQQKWWNLESKARDLKNYRDSAGRPCASIDSSGAGTTSQDRRIKEASNLEWEIDRLLEFATLPDEGGYPSGSVLERIDTLLSRTYELNRLIYLSLAEEYSEMGMRNQIVPWPF